MVAHVVSSGDQEPTVAQILVLERNKGRCCRSRIGLRRLEAHATAIPLPAPESLKPNHLLNLVLKSIDHLQRGLKEDRKNDPPLKNKPVKSKR